MQNYPIGGIQSQTKLNKDSNMFVPTSKAVADYIKASEFNSLIIAANNADSRIKAIANYTCDGIDDQIEIQAAIDSLPTTGDYYGGRIILSQGQFNISAVVTLTDHLWIEGSGMITTTLTLTNGANCNMFYYTGTGIFITLKAMSLYGNKTNNNSGSGIYFVNALKDPRLEDLYISSFKQHGLYRETMWGDKYTNVIIEHCEGYGAWLKNGTEGTLNNCKFVAGEGEANLFIDSASHISVIGGSYGLSQKIGIKIGGALGSYNKIIGVDCGGNNQSETVDTPGILIEKYMYNVIVDNDLSGSKQTYAIWIESGANHTIIKNNSTCQFITAAIKDEGKHTRYFEIKSDVFMDCVAALADYVLADKDLTTIFTTTYPDKNPDVPRNLTYLITDGDTSISDFRFVIFGKDVNGYDISEIFAYAGGLSQTGSKAFAIVDYIYRAALVGANAGDLLDVGISDKLGIAGKKLNESADVFKVKKNTADAAVGTVDINNATVDCANITGGDDFTIYYRSNLNVIE